MTAAAGKIVCAWGIALCGLTSVACDESVDVSGTVFVDIDGDGVLSTGDRALANTHVTWEGRVWTRTDSQGRYALTAERSGLVWVRTPDGFSPAPTWAPVQSGLGSMHVDLAVTPSPASGELTMVVAADSHMHSTHEKWGPEALVAALDQATDMIPTPHFVTIVGDITQANRPREFEAIRDALRDIDTPFVPVPGNHDWYDGGDAYRANFGPDMYSFDAGGAHHVVLNLMADEQTNIDFLRADLARTEPDSLVLAYTHAPPDDAYARLLESEGVDYLFTGHWHSNRTVDHGTMREYNTQAFIMGGIDFTPAGYRVVTLRDGDMRVAHRTIVDRNVVGVSAPRDGECVPQRGGALFAAAEIGATQPRMRARIDEGPWRALDYEGGWTHRGALGALTPGRHTLTVAAYAGAMFAGSDSIEIHVCDDELATPQLANWSQLQGSADHAGRAPLTIAPPLRTAWVQSVGGHLQGGSPVVANGRVFVSVVDLADATRGGVLALDARTGARLWRYTTGYAVRNAPAVGDGMVVVADNNGGVHALDAATGALVWRYDLSRHGQSVVSAMYAAPTIRDGRVYAGTQKHFAALDLDTGVPAWTADPSPNAAWLGSYAAAGVGGGVVIGAFARGVDGMVAWDARTGEERWRLPPPVGNAVNMSPVIAGGRAYAGPADSTLYAIELATGDLLWEHQLDENGFNWGYDLAATPALADGTLFVPTQHGVLHALDADTGASLWRFEAASPAVVHPRHYEARAKAFAASPAVTGSIVWVGGADGRLSAVEAATGQEIWHTAFAAPILSGVAPAGDYLYVSTYDGLIHALVPAALSVPQPPASPGNAATGDACRGRKPTPGPGNVVLLIGAVWLATRRRDRAP